MSSQVLRSQVLSAAKDPLRRDVGGPSPLTRLRTWAAIRTVAVAAAATSLTQAAIACPVCFGGSSSISKGMDTAILFLLSVVGLVQLGIVALFISFWRRAKELRRKRESFRLLEGGVR
jgi:hypothetical protein